MTNPTPITAAVLFVGTGQSCSEVQDLIGPHDPQRCVWKSCTYDGGFVMTSDGPSEFSRGDWVIKNADGTMHVASSIRSETARRTGIVRALMCAWVADEVSEGRMVEVTGLDRLTLRKIRNEMIDIGKAYAIKEQPNV